MGKTILVIDDDSITAELLLKVVQNKGYNAITASNGKIALEKLSTISDLEVIFCDLEMPEMNGMDFIKAYQASNSAKGVTHPVIMLSSNTKPETVRQIWDVGAFDFIAKPIDYDHLVASLDLAIEHKSREDNKKNFDNISEIEHAGSFIDWEVADRLVKVLGVDVVTDVIRKFESQAFKDIWVIKDFFRNNEFRKIRVLSHRLAGTALNVGLRRVGIKCKVVETLCLNNDANILLLIEELIENIKQDLDIFKFMIKTKKRTVA